MLCWQVGAHFMWQDQVELNIGTDDYRQKGVFLDEESLRRHLYILGKTGTGKSTLILNLLTQWIQHGRGAAVIDPHGDLCETLLQYVPKCRSNDVVLIEPASGVVSWNPLSNVPKELRPRRAQGTFYIPRQTIEASGGQA